MALAAMSILLAAKSWNACTNHPPSQTQTVVG